jgi:phage antirepressor YoqD-like protein
MTDFINSERNYRDPLAGVINSERNYRDPLAGVRTKKIEFRGICLDAVRKDGEIYLEFKQLCDYFGLSSGYYSQKIKKEVRLSKALGKQFLKTAKGLRSKNIINIKYLDEFVLLLKNSFQNLNLATVSAKLDELLILLYSSFSDPAMVEEYVPYTELVATREAPVVLKEINFQDINLLALKRKSDGKIFVALKKLFDQFGLDPIIQLQKLRDDQRLSDFITKIPVEIGDRIRNMFFLDIAALPEFLDEISTVKEELLPVYTEFKSKIKNIIMAEFEENGFNIPKTYFEALSRIITNEDINNTLREENLKLMLENEEIRAKAEMYDRMLDARNAMDMKQVANVFGFGRNRLFEYLREINVLISDGPEHNLPYQKYIDCGYFIVRKVIIHRTNGDEIKTQTLVTPRGLGFMGRILKRGISNNLLAINIENIGKNLSEPLKHFN